MKGWVYIISNQAFPGMIKVGYSTKDPAERAKELGTGSPFPYQVEYEVLVDNPRQVEKLAHEVLSFVNAGKEWFECDIPVALKAIKKVCSSRTTYLENHVGKKEVLPSSSSNLRVEAPSEKSRKPTVEEQLSLAKKGDVDAQYDLACRYDAGDEVKKNLKEAYRWFLSASLKGHTLANLAAGKAHLTGRGTEKSAEKAMPFIRYSAEEGNAEAQYLFAKFATYPEIDLIEHEFADEDAFHLAWMQQSADQGFAPAHCELGVINFLNKKFDEAFICYKQSAENGYALAQRYLADCYLDGQGCKQDLREAERWYSLAAKGGDRIAKNKLQNIRGSGGKI